MEFPKQARAKPAKAAVDALGDGLRGGTVDVLGFWARAEDQLFIEDAQGPEGFCVVGMSGVVAAARGGSQGGVCGVEEGLESVKDLVEEPVAQEEEEGLVVGVREGSKMW